MTLDDLQKLEIGLELYKREQPLEGKCDQIIDLLLRVVRHDMSRIQAEPVPKQGSSNS